MTLRTGHLAAVATLLPLACAARPATDDVARAAAERLVLAAPADWPEAITEFTAVEAEDPARVLVDAALRHPDALGAECAVALASRFDVRGAEAELVALLAAAPPLAARAAQALGTLASTVSRDALARAMDDATLDPLVRTAAAAALLDRGERGPASSFLAAVLLAGSPDGQAERVVRGLPDKARWAHERLLAIEAIRRAAGGEDFGLHHDASWPALAASTTRMRTWFAERAR